MEMFFHAVNDWADRKSKYVTFVRDFADEDSAPVMWALFSEKDGMGVFQVEVKQMSPKKTETSGEFASRVEKKIEAMYFAAVKARRQSKQMIPLAA